MHIETTDRRGRFPLFAAFALGLGIVCAHAAVRPLDTSWGNLEGTWKFTIDPDSVGEGSGWQAPGFDDSAWQNLRVPGLWEAQGITDPRPGQSPKPKGNLPWTDYDGVAWYRTTVAIPEAWRGKPLVLQLGRVDDLDRTFVNGTPVGESGRGARHPSTLVRSYLVPATVWRYGRPNTIAVRVEDLGGPGGLAGPLVSLLPEDAMTIQPLPSEERPFEERFREPPGSVRILKIVHRWPDPVEAERSLIDTLRQQGFGGLVTNVAWGDDYLRNAEAWDQLRRVVSRARELRMALWLYDEKGYPSGTAGGQVIEGRPEWEPEGLLITTRVVEGPAELRLPPGTLKLAAAYPAGRVPAADAAVDLADRVRDGQLAWSPPPGRWRIVLITRDRIYEGTHAAGNVYRHQPYTNLLRPEPTERFLELTHDAYARELGDDLGRIFQATFTDEPSLMSAFLSPMPYAVLPWAPDLPTEFERRRGYPLEPELAALAVADTARAKQVRYDFWQTVTELVRDSFTRPVRDWCRKHNLPAGGHLIWEEGLRMHVPFYGSLYACMRDFDAPGIDCLTSLPQRVPWSVARLVSSVAELEGRGLTMSETSDHAQRYRPKGDKRPVRTVSPAEIRGTVNRLMVGGINTITSYYSFTGISSAELLRLNEYIGRCCTALRGGRQVADIAVVYPVESLWPHYDPAAHRGTKNPIAGRIEQAYAGALDALFAAGRDVTILDSQALAEAEVGAGTLRHGALRWKVLVLPGVETLPEAAWKNVSEFRSGGGILVALGLLPANTERRFPDPRIRGKIADWFGPGNDPRVRISPDAGICVFLPSGMEALLPTVLDRLLEPDIRMPAGSPLRTTHRRIDGHEVYFVINDSPNPFRGSIALAAQGACEAWDPETGKQRVVRPDGIELDLPPYGGVILRAEQARARTLIRMTRDGIEAAPPIGLPPPRPGQSPGAHVAAKPIAAVTGTDGQPGWRVVGEIRRSRVDTFLFLRLRYPAPVDASNSDFVVVDVDVPGGQDVTAPAFLFAVEADGGEFLAPLGFKLNEAGPHRVWVPWDRLKAVPWGKTGDGVLDRGKLVEFRVGWGGYYGTEGERLEFTARAPRLGRLGP